MATKKKAEKLKQGRPSKWQPAFTKQAEKLCLLGATNEELADFFEVNVDTIYTWQKDIKVFSEAIKKGKMMADANVTDRLYQRAMGFEHDSEELKVVALGSGEGSEVQRIKVRKIYPPDTIAAIFWLKNRQKDKWRDRVEQDITSKGEKVGIPMTDEQVDKIIDALKTKRA